MPLNEIARKEGFDALGASNGKEALLKAEYYKPDIIFLDINLPDENGITLCRKIKSNDRMYGNPFIAAVTGDITVIEKLWDAGFDKYIEKPFKNSELVYFMRKHNQEKYGKKLIYGGLTVHMDEGLVFEDETEIKLAKMEYELLKYFIENKGIMIDKETIMKEVWKEKYFETSDRAIISCICRLKKKLGTISENLENNIKFGYRLR